MTTNQRPESSEPTAAAGAGDPGGWLTADITYSFTPARVMCDGRCAKAWGINNRPRHQLSQNCDDFEYLADRELGTAPTDPGTYEGGHGKPSDASGFPNKWCVRECERCAMTYPAEAPNVYPLDFSQRVRNIP